jgi:hypothetical protein
MFGKTISQIQETATDTLKPYVEQISTALYIIAGLAVMILLALVTK